MDTLNTSHLEKQLEELQLIKFSLLPGEILLFLDHCKVWDDLLEIYSSGDVNKLPGNEDMEELPQVTFQVSLESWNVWFEVTFSKTYTGFNNVDDAGRSRSNVSIKGEDITRAEQEEWSNLVKEKLTEIGETEYPFYQLLSLHLLPLLHEKAQSTDSTALPEDHLSPDLQADDNVYQSHQSHPASSNTSQSQTYHALFVSHHLVSPKKRRSLQGWSSSLHISGFAKLGYPGVIYAQGSKEDVEEFVENVKGMQWPALRLRFLEALVDETKKRGSGVKEEKEERLEGWKEFQKVGEVMEEMRRIGRESYVVEMGIGSAGSGAG
ncbi:hypothetical protein K435DRAFT_779787 [Dendrothele bispora CBS 962.96]|uniref:Small nuclear ribonucleoprotein Prp3 C-terminal domain-containing protein n=1 Tax=Dendrothele bispora (strain CBS 962.96) TaxID=1314807 RepID=A0A4S8LVE0_DENBC|nr:hypothetical protein K435DRAFT_779787 [Dendrothele bispora CBS 962.96]